MWDLYWHIVCQCLIDDTPSFAHKRVDFLVSTPRGQMCLLTASMLYDHWRHHEQPVIADLVLLVPSFWLRSRSLGLAWDISIRNVGGPAFTRLTANAAVIDGLSMRVRMNVSMYNCMHVCLKSIRTVADIWT